MACPKSENILNGSAICKRNTFYHKDLQIVHATPAQRKPRPENMEGIKFGQIFADHMLEVDWTETEGWGHPRICAVHDFHLHPASKVFHYAPEVFEGMKAFRSVADGRIRMFRPEMNMARMRKAAERAALPDFDPTELLALIMELVRTDADWIPRIAGCSLYIRPTLIATDATLELSNPKRAKLFVITGPVGSYFPTGLQPVTVLADPTVARAFPGGAGGFKMGCNYSPTILIGKVASERFGCHQVLWLSGDDEKLTEVGVMNIFILWRDQQGELELVTPPTVDCLVLDGVVRDSCLALAREWGGLRVSERYPTMAELREAIGQRRLLQMFGTGTACAVCPVNKVVYKCPKTGKMEELPIPPTVDMTPKENMMQRFYEAITGIQYGRTKNKEAEWIRFVEE